MKTKIAGKNGKKRSLSETSLSTKSNQNQVDIVKFGKGPKKAKLDGIKQNGNSASEKISISKVADKQRKEKNKAMKQQSGLVKPSETKKDTKEKRELTVVQPDKKFGKSNKSRRGRLYNNPNITVEEITKKIAEIRSREVLSKRAKKILGILNRKLRECGSKSEKLDTIAKKNNKKVEHFTNILSKNKQKANDEIKKEAEKKYVQNKGKSQEDDIDVENDYEGDSDVEEESEENESKNELMDSLTSGNEVDDESDEDEDEEEVGSEDEEEMDDEEIESEEEMDDEEIESGEEMDDEEVESEEDGDEEVESEEVESEEDEDEDDEDDEKDEKNKKEIVSEVRKQEMQTKNKQEQNKNKQELNKNKQEQNKTKQVLQSSDNQKKEEMKKKRYVLFVGNLPLNITEGEIKQHFSTKIDTITSIRIPTKPDKTPRGFAYVEVTNNKDFEKGLSLNHSFLKKRRINVECSIPTGGKNAHDKKFIVAKNMKLQALQKAGKLAGGNQKKFKKVK